MKSITTLLRPSIYMVAFFGLVAGFQNCSNFQAASAASSSSAGTNEAARETGGGAVRILDASGSVSDAAAESLRDLAIRYLGRSPAEISAAQAREYWGGLLLQGKSFAEVAQIFAASDEAWERGRQILNDFFGTNIPFSDIRSVATGYVGASQAQWRNSLVESDLTSERIRAIAIEALGRDGNLLTRDQASSYWKQNLRNGLSMAQLRMVFFQSTEGQQFAALTNPALLDVAAYLERYPDVKNSVRSGMTLEHWAKIHWFRYGLAERRTGISKCELTIDSNQIAFGGTARFRSTYQGYGFGVTARWIGTNTNLATSGVTTQVDPQPTAVMQNPYSAILTDTDYVNNAPNYVGTYTRQLQYLLGDQVICTTNSVSATFLAP